MFLKRELLCYTGMLSDDEKLEKRTLAADVEQPEKAECSLESHPYESARQLQESEEETEATSGEAAPADRDVGGIEEEEEEEEDDDDDDGGNGVVSPYRSTKWRRPSRLSLLSPTRSPPRSLDSEPEPEPDHWPKVKPTNAQRSQYAGYSAALFRTRATGSFRDCGLSSNSGSAMSRQPQGKRQARN